MGSCFAQPGFAQRNFIQGCPTGVASSVDQRRIPRWLVKFERTGKTNYLSDVGGEVEGNVYVPAIAAVNLSAQVIDLERMVMPSPSATVNVSPSALLEEFLEVWELGQAKVTISSWDGYTARPIIKADLEQPGFGYDGEPTTFRLTEGFAKDKNYPELVVDNGMFPFATANGARGHVWTQVWGTIPNVPGFRIEMDGERWMVAGHNVATLPTGPGTEGRFKDKGGHTYIGSDIVELEGAAVWAFKSAQGVKSAADLIKLLIGHYTDYTDDDLDQVGLGALYAHLGQFPVGGYTDQAGKVFDLITGRFQREFMFVMWEQAGLVTAAAIDPTAHPARTLVMHVHLLQLEEQVEEERRYTVFKTRYGYDNGWPGLVQLYPSNNPYLQAMANRWGKNHFGDPVELPYHATSIDLPDVHLKAPARNIAERYMHVFHRGQRVSYLQLAEYADIRLGTMVALVDPERGYDEQPAILIGRQWITPELIVQTYRTIQPVELVEMPRKVVTPPEPPAPAVDGPALSGSCIPTFGSGSGGTGSSWEAPGPFTAPNPLGGESVSVLYMNGASATTQIKCPAACSVADALGTGVSGYAAWGVSYNSCYKEHSTVFRRIELWIYTNPDCSDTPTVITNNGSESTGPTLEPPGFGPLTKHHARGVTAIPANSYLVLFVELTSDDYSKNSSVLFDPFIDISATDPGGAGDTSDPQGVC